MEIWNNGKFPSDLEIEHLNKKHKSEPPNRNIAKVFYDRKYFDGWGTGIVKIFDLCHENDIPEPKYEIYSGGIEVIFRFKEPIAITKQVDLIKKQLSERQEAILTLIVQHGAIGVKKIMSELVNPPTQRMVRKDLSYLKATGLVELKGHTRTALWSLKTPL